MTQDKQRTGAPWWAAFIGPALAVAVGAMGLDTGADIDKTKGAADTLLSGHIDHERRLSYLEGKLGIAGEPAQFAQAEPKQQEKETDECDGWRPPLDVGEMEDAEEQPIQVKEPPPPPVERKPKAKRLKPKLGAPAIDYDSGAFKW